jgi:hypothetical protein
VQPALNLERGLRAGIVEVKRVQRECEGLKMVTIRVLHPFPPLEGDTLHLYVMLRLGVTL